MNKITKSLILGVAVIATLAGTVEVSSAGWRDRGFHGREWRYRHGPGWRGNWAAAGIIGLTAGVIVGEALSQPRVVHRERVYVDPDDAEYVGPVDGDYPDDATPRHVVRTAPADRYQDERYPDDAGPMDDQAEDEDYFPDRPQREHATRRDDVADQGTLQPWTAKWRNYCKQRYSSFNSTTGTYAGYDGKQHFCTAG